MHVRAIEKNWMLIVDHQSCRVVTIIPAVA